VWPPLAHKHKLAEGLLLWQKASLQTKPLNIPSKSIKASRDWLGIDCLYLILPGASRPDPHRKLEMAFGKAHRIEKLNTTLCVEE